MKLQAADKLSLGGLLSLEVKQQLKDPVLEKKVGQLSYGAIETLMRTPRNGSMMFVSKVRGQQEFSLPDQATLASLRELEGKKLIVFSEKPLDEFLRYIEAHAEKTSDQSHYRLKGSDPSVEETVDQESYRLTDAGAKAADAITQVVASQLVAEPKSSE